MNTNELAASERQPRTIKAVDELFTAPVKAFWATTYSMNVNFFTEFLFRRFGDAPINAAVLMDHTRMAANLSQASPEQFGALRSANRRWLWRGVHLNGMAFHPKSYLRVGMSRTDLLIGSGNLTVDGIDSGREMFTAFRSDTPAGELAIATWRSWMRRVVERVGDVTLAERFQRLEKLLPDATSTLSPGLSPVIHNLDDSILDQLANRVVPLGTVDELWLSAPFFDVGAHAVERVVELLQPKRIHLVLGHPIEVDGPSLARALERGGCGVEISTVNPKGFVHAKLIAAAGPAGAWILSGSANLSQAALAKTVGSGGNAELAVFAPMKPADVRESFIPPESSLTVLPIEELHHITFDIKPESAALPVRLVTAALRPGGEVTGKTDPPAESQAWFLDDLNGSPVPISPSPEGFATNQPILGRVVQIVDEFGQELSNRLIVDDPAALSQALDPASSGGSGGRPPEFSPSDEDSAVVRELIALNRHLIMDVSEVLPLDPGSGAPTNDDDEQDDDLWDRLERERVLRDPRAHAYNHSRMGSQRGGNLGDSILEILQITRDRMPMSREIDTSDSWLRRTVQASEDEQAASTESTDEGKDDKDRRWKPSTRIRVAARNRYLRWADAQGDPRLAWINALAPVDNFTALTASLVQLRLERASGRQVELTEDDLDLIWLRLLASVFGTGRGDGWADRIDEVTFELARERMEDWLPDAIGALSWLAVWPHSERRRRIVEAQTALIAARDRGLLRTGSDSALFASVALQRSVLTETLEHELDLAVNFIDDDLWCERIAGSLELKNVRFVAENGSQRQVWLEVSGVSDALQDPRIPRLLLSACSYRKSNRLTVKSASSDWRLAFTADEEVIYLASRSDDDQVSASSLSMQALCGIADDGGSLCTLFSFVRPPPEPAVSSAEQGIAPTATPMAAQRGPCEKFGEPV